MPVIVVFTVSSSVQSIPKAVRATRPLIAIIAVLLPDTLILKYKQTETYIGPLLNLDN